MSRILKFLISVLVYSLVISTQTYGQEYPTKSITLVVPYPPGGPTDNIARIIAAELGIRLKQSVIVLNRGGGGATIGSAAVARAAPDGYTFLLATSDHSTNPIAYPEIPYKTETAFTPVALIATSTLVLIVNRDFKVQSIPELVAFAKANPGMLNYATTTTGGNTHLAAELFSQLAKVKMTQVPYQGGAGAMTDLLGGQVQLMFSAIGSSLPMINDKKVRPLGITTSKVTAAAPELIPIARTLPGFDVGAWYGIVAPSGTPQQIIDRINTEVDSIIRMSSVAQRLVSLGADPAGGSPTAFKSFIHEDIRNWDAIAKLANVSSNLK